MTSAPMSLFTHQAGINELVRLLVYKGVLTGDEGHQVFQAMLDAKAPDQTPDAPKP